MTIIATPNGFSGLSTNTKPTVGVSPGNIFIETDTNKIYIWNNSSWSLILTSAPTEVQFLGTQFTNGNGIITFGSITSTGVVCSYTPATGKTFTLYRARCNNNNTATCTADLRNNTTINDSISCNNQIVSTDYGIKGDQLIGNSSKTYDINGTIGTGTLKGSIEGYIQ